MNFFRSKNEKTKICVLTANLTGIVAELIAQAIEHQPDIELLGNVTKWSEINDFASRTTIFIIGSEDEIFSSKTCLPLLNDYPQLKILILKAGNEGSVYWRVLHCEQFQVLSAQILIESIRYIHSLLFTDLRQRSISWESN